MLLFLYGEDRFRSQQKLQELKARYIDASLGDTNLSVLDPKSTQPNELASQLLAFPFLAKTRMVVLPELLSAGSKPLQEKFLDLIEKIPETTVAVAYEPGVPDQRTSAFKTILKAAKTQTFPLLTGHALTQWMTAWLEQWETRIDPAAAAQLVLLTNGQTGQLAMELRKLATSLIDRPAAERTITSELVAELVSALPTEEIFALTDAVLAQQPGRAMEASERLLSQGVAAQQLIGLLAGSWRSLALIHAALQAGTSNPAAIASVTKLNPYVVRKQLPAARSLSLKEIAAKYTALFELDLALKRGTIEPNAGMDLLILETANQNTA